MALGKCAFIPYSSTDPFIKWGHLSLSQRAGWGKVGMKRKFAPRWLPLTCNRRKLLLLLRVPWYQHLYNWEAAQQGLNTWAVEPMAPLITWVNLDKSLHFSGPQFTYPWKGYERASKVFHEDWWDKHIKISWNVTACSTLAPMKPSMAAARHTNGLSLNSWPNPQVACWGHPEVHFCLS